MIGGHYVCLNEVIWEVKISQLVDSSTGTVGALIFGRLSVLKNNLSEYREICLIFPNLHHMIDMIPYFKMLHIII